MVRGFPFDTQLPESVITSAEALGAFEKLRRKAADVPEMTLDEINAEISAARQAMKRKSKALSD